MGFSLASGSTNADAVDLSAALAAKAALAGATYTGTHDFSGATVTGLSAPGLVLVTSQSFSAVSSVSVNNCFSSAYANYRIVFRCTASANGSLLIRLRASGVDATGANYSGTTVRASGSSIAVNNNGDGVTAKTMFTIGMDPGHVQPHFSMDLISPNLASNTYGHFVGQAAEPGAYGRTAVYGDFHQESSMQFDGFTVYPSTGTITGSLRVYGYRNS
jgi:hypothetical protein